jgi:hypothetical protein
VLGIRVSTSGVLVYGLTPVPSTLSSLAVSRVDLLRGNLASANRPTCASHGHTPRCHSDRWAVPRPGDSQEGVNLRFRREMKPHMVIPRAAAPARREERLIPRGPVLHSIKVSTLGTLVPCVGSSRLHSVVGRGPESRRRSEAWHRPVLTRPRKPSQSRVEISSSLPRLGRTCSGAGGSSAQTRFHRQPIRRGWLQLAARRATHHVLG